MTAVGIFANIFSLWVLALMSFQIFFSADCLSTFWARVSTALYRCRLTEIRISENFCLVLILELELTPGRRCHLLLDLWFFSLTNHFQISAFVGGLSLHSHIIRVEGGKCPIACRFVISHDLEEEGTDMAVLDW